jgi:hypothetical protein
MLTSQETLELINNLKNSLETLVVQKADLKDADIIDISREIDLLLNEYTKLNGRKQA